MAGQTRWSLQAVTVLIFRRLQFSFERARPHGQWHCSAVGSVSENSCFGSRLRGGPAGCAAAVWFIAVSIQIPPLPPVRSPACVPCFPRHRQRITVLSSFELNLSPSYCKLLRKYSENTTAVGTLAGSAPVCTTLWHGPLERQRARAIGDRLDPGRTSHTGGGQCRGDQRCAVVNGDSAGGGRVDSGSGSV